MTGSDTENACRKRMADAMATPRFARAVNRFVELMLMAQPADLVRYNFHEDDFQVVRSTVECGRVIEKVVAPGEGLDWLLNADADTSPLMVLEYWYTHRAGVKLTKARRAALTALLDSNASLLGPATAAKYRNALKP